MLVLLSIYFLLAPMLFCSSCQDYATDINRHCCRDSLPPVYPLTSALGRGLFFNYLLAYLQADSSSSARVQAVTKAFLAPDFHLQLLLSLGGFSPHCGLTRLSSDDLSALFFYLFVADKDFSDDVCLCVFPNPKCSLVQLQAYLDEFSHPPAFTSNAPKLLHPPQRLVHWEDLHSSSNVAGSASDSS